MTTTAPCQFNRSTTPKQLPCTGTRSAITCIPSFALFVYYRVKLVEFLNRLPQRLKESHGRLPNPLPGIMLLAACSPPLASPPPVAILDLILTTVAVNPVEGETEECPLWRVTREVKPAWRRLLACPSEYNSLKCNLRSRSH